MSLICVQGWHAMPVVSAWWCLDRVESETSCFGRHPAHCHAMHRLCFSWHGGITGPGSGLS